jgi:hypothetical protein
MLELEQNQKKDFLAFFKNLIKNDWPDQFSKSKINLKDLELYFSNLNSLKLMLFWLMK